MFFIPLLLFDSGFPKGIFTWKISILFFIPPHSIVPFISHYPQPKSLVIFISSSPHLLLFPHFPTSAFQTLCLSDPFLYTTHNSPLYPSPYQSSCTFTNLSSPIPLPPDTLPQPHTLPSHPCPLTLSAPTHFPCPLLLQLPP